MRPSAVLLPLLLSACAAHRNGEAVRSMRFEGNDRPGLTGFLQPQSDRALRVATDIPVSSWAAFVAPRQVEPAWLDEAALDRAGARIELWYANHGYFDARFLGWEVRRPRRPEARRVKAVDLVGHVDQGEPSRVGEVRFEGLPAGPLRNRVAELVEVAEGDVFDRDAYRSTLAGIEAYLHEQAFAYAKVSGEVRVDAEAHTATVTVRVDPGPPCTFGEVRYAGRPGVDTRLLDRWVSIEPGETYSTREIERTRAALFGLRTYAVVNVLPDLSDPTRRAVPITVQLRPTETEEVTAGPGFGLEPGLQQLSGSVSYANYNVGDRLWRWENELEAGVATLVDGPKDLAQLDPRTDISPIGSVTSTFTLPRFVGRFTLSTQFSFEVRPEPGYRYLSPTAHPSLSWEAVPHFTPTAGYRLTYIDYYTETFDTHVSDLGAAETPFGDEVIDPGLLSVLEQGATWDSRNDLIQPHRGWYWNLALAEAGLGGDFQFLRARGEVRTFRALTFLPGEAAWQEDLVLAARAGGGIIVPYGDAAHAKVPLPERLFLGGGTTVRGWPANTLGPRDEPVDGYRAPLGGKLAGWGSVEGRARVYGQLYFVPFVDVGRVWRDPADLDLAGLQVSVGSGFRYLTSIGPVRVDLAWVVNRDPEFADIGPPIAVHFGLSEAF